MTVYGAFGFRWAHAGRQSTLRHQTFNKTQQN